MEEGRTLGALLVALAAAALAGVVVVRALLRSRNMQLWIGAHLRQWLRRRLAVRPPPRHVYFCLADHFEPFGGTPDRERALRRVGQWLAQYPALAQRHSDSGGRPPQHTFFYPAEEYDAEVLDALAALRGRGLGDVDSAPRGRSPEILYATSHYPRYHKGPCLPCRPDVPCRFSAVVRKLGPVSTRT